VTGDEAVELEMTYTTWEHSCKEPHVAQDDLRECRRQKDHKGLCASGFGKGLLFWGKS